MITRYRLEMQRRDGEWVALDYQPFERLEDARTMHTIMHQGEGYACRVVEVSTNQWWESIAHKPEWQFTIHADTEQEATRIAAERAPEPVVLVKIIETQERVVEQLPACEVADA